VGGAPEFNAIMGCYKAIMEQDTCTKDAAFRYGTSDFSSRRSPPQIQDQRQEGQG
jgi:hypothetical protein